MHYPWWHVPFLTAPMLIAAGVGAARAWSPTTRLAAACSWRWRRGTRIARGNETYLAYLKEHAWFFILLTVVFGAITGVGIWWTIGLAIAAGHGDA